MPELPEVESLCRQLRNEIIGAEIEELVILDSKLGPFDNLKGRSIISVKRLGKRIVLAMDDCRGLELHLRMTGRLLWENYPQKELPSHCRFILALSLGRVICLDPRRFAKLSLVKDAYSLSAPADALSTESGKMLMVKSRSRSRSIKSFLMDQQIIVGIGNIYACEILHQAAINPRRKAADLRPEDWQLIEKEMNAILSEAIACRGTSISDWRDLYGRQGEYQNKLQVYGREGEQCPRCGGVILRKSQLGRGTWFCPDCQK